MPCENQTILFQGDSITDAGRNREAQVRANDGNALGFGYASRAAGLLLSQRPKAGLNFFNRGISGNRVTDLLTRWQGDAILLKPDWISILIGVNDTWHHYGSQRGTSLELFEKVYRLVLEETRGVLPATKIVICEPFAYGCDVFKPEWLDNLYARAAITRRLAEEYQTHFVPFQSLFDQLLEEGDAAFWLPDGVHPSPGAHHRMAEFWCAQTGWTQ